MRKPMQFQYGENCGALEGVRDLFPHTSGNVEGTFRGGNEISLEISPPLLRKRLSFNQRVMQTRWEESAHGANIIIFENRFARKLKFFISKYSSKYFSLSRRSLIFRNIFEIRKKLCPVLFASNKIITNSSSV